MTPSRSDSSTSLPDLPSAQQMLPLHERLSGIRESSFGNNQQLSSSTAGNAAADAPGSTVPQSSPSTQSAVVAPRNPMIGAEHHNQGMPSADPAPGQLVQPGIVVDPSVASERPIETMRPQTTYPNAGYAAAESRSATNDSAVLITKKGPTLNVETKGPRQIAVGKESAYELTVQNSGETAADEVVISVDLPKWADVLGAEASVGATRTEVADKEAATVNFQWRVGRLEPRGQARLVLRIVPRQSRPFDLGVACNYKPVAAQAMIEVQEPKLAMNLQGPSEVLYGEKEVYRLQLSNTGNGAAENVTISLMPIGTNINQPVSHKLGTLAAGGKKTIEVELTARQVGNLVIQVEAHGDGGVHAELSETVLVRRAALQVEIQGPKVQFVGTVATYHIRIRNPGTAPARDVKLSASVPAGAKYVSGIENSQLTANGTKILWTIDSLLPGAERIYSVQCSLGLPGPSRLEVLSTAKGDLTASAGATTRVDAMADLSLSVKDPVGPVPVGREAVYEIRVSNRGTKDAQDVEVTAFFADGVEPTTAEGSQHKINPGQIIFDTIPSLAAGEEIVLKIHAKASRAGNHSFRAEVHCKPLDTRLVSEETTHFYGQEPVQAFQGSANKLGVAPGMRPPRMAEPSVRTADRRMSGTVGPGAGRSMPARTAAQPTTSTPQGRLMPMPVDSQPARPVQPGIPTPAVRSQ